MNRGRRLAIATGLIGLVVAIGLLQPTGLFAPLDTLSMKIVDRLRLFPGAGLVTAGAIALDRIGEAGGRLFIALVVALFLGRAGKPRAILWLLVTVGAMMLLSPLMKLVFAAPRPDAIEPLVVVTSNSFPSGHASGAMALYGALALLFRKPLVVLFCAGMILATGLSRVWLGVHWPSDVVGGWLAGAALLTVAAIFCPRRKRNVASSLNIDRAPSAST